MFGTTIPFEGNWNLLIYTKAVALRWKRSELLSRLKGIETLGGGRKFNVGMCSELLSRLKGIETLEVVNWSFHLYLRSELLSRLKGIETSCLKFNTVTENSSELLSRLKGIETILQRELEMFLSVCSELLSRLKGIETHWTRVHQVYHLVRNYYPVWRELKHNFNSAL